MDLLTNIKEYSKYINQILVEYIPCDNKLNQEEIELHINNRFTEIEVITSEMATRYTISIPKKYLQYNISYNHTFIYNNEEYVILSITDTYLQYVNTYNDTPKIFKGEIIKYISEIGMMCRDHPSNNNINNLYRYTDTDKYYILCDLKNKLISNKGHYNYEGNK